MSGISRATRELVLARDNYSCVSCRRHIGGLDGYSIQHRIPRGMGGSKHDDRINLPSNLVTLCGSAVTGCHGWVERHRTIAGGWGYLLHRLDEPSVHPVFTADGWTLYRNDGSIAYPPEPSTPERRAELARDIERARLQRMGVAA